jgi:hypothetical protein
MLQYTFPQNNHLMTQVFAISPRHSSIELSRGQIGILLNYLAWVSYIYNFIAMGTFQSMWIHLWCSRYWDFQRGFGAARASRGFEGLKKLGPRRSPSLPFDGERSIAVNHC